jgi:serine protease Do
VSTKNKTIHMLNLLKPAVFLLACGLGSTAVYAQSGKSNAEKNITKEETVIIKKEGGDGKTIIEIKNGNVYVNGEAVVSVEDANAGKVRKKVIIENGDINGSDLRPFSFFNNDDDEPAFGGPRKAMLGVLTDPTSGKTGALIKDVTPGSAAEKAGLQSGDVITGIDGKTIKDAKALVAEISAQHEAGDKVTINYKRDGKERTTTAKLQPAGPATAMRGFRFNPDGMRGGMPNSFFRAFPFAAGDDMEATPKLGVGVEDRADGEGVRVLSVKPGSAAASAGLEEGDVITHIDGEKVSSVDELQMDLRSMKGGEKLKLEYQRAGKPATIDITLPKTVKRKDL